MRGPPPAAGLAWRRLPRGGRDFSRAWDAARSIASGRVIGTSYHVIRSQPALVQTRLDLDGRVLDAEAVLERATGVAQEMVVEAGVRPHQMHGERGLGRAHRPDVQVVHLGDAGQGGEIAFDRMA